MKRHSAPAVASCSLILATAIVAACVGSDPDLATPTPDAASGDVGSNRDDGASSGSSSSSGSPAEASTPPKGILSGVVDTTFKGGVLTLDGVTGGTELVNASCTADDRIVTLAHVHTGTTTHSWYLVVFAPDGTVQAQRKVVDSGEPMDAVLGPNGWLYGVGVVSGFANISIFKDFSNVPPVPQPEISVNLGGTVPFRVASSNGHVFAAGLSSSPAGVRIWRFDQYAQLSGYMGDAGSTIVIEGNVDKQTPRPTVAALGDDAFFEDLLKNGTLGAVGIHPDGTKLTFLNALVQKNINVPIDLTPMGSSALATTGFVDADAGTSAVARAFADGGTDPSYGGELSQLATSKLRPWRILTGPDGFLLVASAPVAGDATMVAGLSRLLPDGSFDTSFGTGGVVAVPGAATASAVRGLCWQAGHQRAIIAGTDNAGSDSAKIVLAAIK
jgi:hypothetical protein